MRNLLIQNNHNKILSYLLIQRVILLLAFFEYIRRRTKLTYPNGVTTTYSYDTAGRLTNLLTQYTELKEQGKKKPPLLKLHTIDSYTYTHDKVGNRLSKTEISDTHTNTDTKYSYDAIYRLLQSTPTRIMHNGKEKEFEHRGKMGSGLVGENGVRS